MELRVRFSSLFGPLLAALALLLLLPMPSAFAQTGCGGTGQPSEVTPSGTNFLLCFEQNDVANRDFTDDGYLEIYMAALDQTAVVTISSKRYPAMNRVLSVPAGTGKTYRITVDTLHYTGGLIDTLSDLWITSEEQPDGRVVQVQSTAPIVCYGMNHKGQTSDGFMALPEPTAGLEYRIMSYPNSASTPARPSQFAVAAFNDNTTVTITPSAPTVGGRTAGVPFTIKLNRGEAVQVQTDGQIRGLDLTGSSVSSDLPVAVYGSHARAEVPVGYTRGSDGQTSRNHLTEAIPPVSTWGKAFVLAPFQIDAAGHVRPEGDLMRVLAQNDNTQVKVNGNLWVTLNHDQKMDTLIHAPTVVESSQPLLVAEFAHTSSTGNDNGDPFMVVIPPMEQSYNAFTFFASSDVQAFPLQKVIIATDSTTLVNSNYAITYDGTFKLPPTAYTPLPTSVNGRSFALLELAVGSAGAHTLTTNLLPAQGFTIVMYGLGAVDGYGYSAGSLLKPLQGIIGHSYPPIAGMEHTKDITIRSMEREVVFIDSAIVRVSPEYSSFGIGVKENVGFDLIDPARSETFHLTSAQPLTCAVHGTVEVYHHTLKWGSMRPAEIPFTLYPESFASVADGGTSQIAVSNYPNPFTQWTTISFALPARGDIAITIYDELGRAVKTLANAEFPEGPYAVRFDRGELPAGVYTCQITSSRLHLNERTAMVIGE